MRCRVANVRTDVTEDPIASIIRVGRINELGTTHPDDGVEIFSETSVITGAIRRHIPEVGILHSDRCENLKS
jgi:hypothetical protein